MSVFNYEFEGRKPSFSQVYKIALQGVQSGAAEIGISWGENWLEISRGPAGLHGYGWIKNISGDDIARTIESGASL